MRIVQFQRFSDKSVRVGLQLGFDGDIVDLNEHLWVKNAKKFIEDGEKNIYVANS